VDRGGHHPSLGTPVNEVNVIAVTRWLHRPERALSAHFQDWLRESHGAASADLEEALEQTFEVVKRAFYLDQQSLSHHLFPSFAHAKHIQVFELFRPGQPLAHLALNWGS